MKQYHDLCNLILEKGEPREDRTGVGTRAIFGYDMRFDLNAGFPLLTTKKVFWRGVVEELLWMLRGESNVRSLQKKGVGIWDEWADENGDLGPVYGTQWRAMEKTYYDENGQPYEEITDQLKELCDGLIKDPFSRRHIMTTWNPAELHRMALPPCHGLVTQFYVSNDNRLSCKMYQRSCDVFLGLPFNIASYALLTHIMASHCGYGVGEFIWTGGDIHIYENHIDQVKLQLQREPRDNPQLEVVTKRNWPWEHEFEDFDLSGYHPHPAIKGDVAV